MAFFTFPSNLTILIGILGLLMLTTRFARTGRRLAFVSLAVLALLGLSPVGNAFMLPLENRFPAWDVSHGVPDGIIVLGGAVDASGPGEQAVLNEAAERLVVVPELARRYPNTRILFSGGNSALMDGGSAEAEFAARLLESLGVERSRITLEDRSRNTVENAVFSKALIQPKSGDRWLLVTSAYHMPRAIGVFRKGGLSGRTLSVRSAHTCRRGCAVAFATMSDGLQRTDTASTNGSDSRILAHRAHLRVVSGANSRRPSKGVAALNDGQ